MEVDNMEVENIPDARMHRQTSITNFMPTRKRSSKPWKSISSDKQASGHVLGQKGEEVRALAGVKRNLSSVLKSVDQHNDDDAERETKRRHKRVTFGEVSVRVFSKDSAVSVGQGGALPGLQSGQSDAEGQPATPPIGTRPNPFSSPPPSLKRSHRSLLSYFHTGSECKPSGSSAPSQPPDETLPLPPQPAVHSAEPARSSPQGEAHLGRHGAQGESRGGADGDGKGQEASVAGARDAKAGTGTSSGSGSSQTYAWRRLHAGAAQGGFPRSRGAVLAAAARGGGGGKPPPHPPSAVILSPLKLAAMSSRIDTETSRDMFYGSPDTKKRKKLAPLAPEQQQQQQAAPTAVAAPPEKLADKYAALERLYEAVESVYSLLHMRRQLCTFESMRQPVEDITHRRFLRHHLAQLVHLYPEAFRLEPILRSASETGAAFGSRWELKVSLLAPPPPPPPPSDGPGPCGASAAAEMEAEEEVEELGSPVKQVPTRLPAMWPPQCSPTKAGVRMVGAGAVVHSPVSSPAKLLRKSPTRSFSSTSPSLASPGRSTRGGGGGGEQLMMRRRATFKERLLRFAALHAPLRIDDEEEMAVEVPEAPLPGAPRSSMAPATPSQQGPSAPPAAPAAAAPSPSSPVESHFRGPTDHRTPLGNNLRCRLDLGPILQKKAQACAATQPEVTEEEEEEAAAAGAGATSSTNDSSCCSIPTPEPAAAPHCRRLQFSPDKKHASPSASAASLPSVSNGSVHTDERVRRKLPLVETAGLHQAAAGAAAHGGANSDASILSSLGLDLLHSVQSKVAEKAAEKCEQAVRERRHRELLAELPGLVDMLRIIFSALGSRHVLSHAELLHKLLSSHTKLTTRLELEAQLTLLLQEAKEWIISKRSLSGDVLYRIQSRADLGAIKRRLLAAAAAAPQPS